MTTLSQKNPEIFQEKQKKGQFPTILSARLRSQIFRQTNNKRRPSFVDWRAGSCLEWWGFALEKGIKMSIGADDQSAPMLGKKRGSKERRIEERKDAESGPSTRFLPIPWRYFPGGLSISMAIEYQKNVKKESGYPLRFYELPVVFGFLSEIFPGM